MASEKLTIIVADDSKVIRKAFSRIMSEEYDLIETEDGQAAWENIEADDRICAVFTDWEMPVMDGLELTRKIRSSRSPRIRTLPIIMVTSKNDDEATTQIAHEAGVTDFVSKPFDTTKLLARAKVHVKERTVEGEEESQDAVMNPASRVGNARYFQEQGGQMVSFANRHNLPMAVALIGIDKLPELMKVTAANERQREDFIMTVGTYVSEVVRKEDTVSRIGQGIFGVLLASTDIKLGYKFAERLQAKVNKARFTLNGKDVKVTLSVGLESSEPTRKRQLPGLVKTSRERLLVASRNGNEIRPALRRKEAPLHKLDSLDKALSLITNKRADNVDTVYLLKRLFPLLVHFDKKHGSELAKAALPIIKGGK